MNRSSSANMGAFLIAYLVCFEVIHAPLQGNILLALMGNLTSLLTVAGLRSTKTPEAAFIVIVPITLQCAGPIKLQ